MFGLPGQVAARDGAVRVALRSECVDERPEMVAAGLEIRVVVEARAAGRQQHGVARARRSRAASSTASSRPVDDLDRRSTADGTRAASAGPVATDCDHARRPDRARPPSVTGRHPCRSRRRSARSARKMRIAADAACGVVAFESLNHATPSDVGEVFQAVRWARRTMASAVARPHRRRRAPTRSPAPTRPSVFVMSCGSARCIAPTSANVAARTREDGARRRPSTRR